VLGLIAGRLVEEHRIKWTTLFFELFPELKIAAHSAYVDMTLEDLFLCQAGLLPYTENEAWADLISRTDSRYEFAQFLISQPPSSTLKGDGKYEFLYSNASYAMACLMLEKVSGKGYEELIDQYIVGDMGLNTYIGFPNTLDADQVWGHTITGNSLESFPPSHEYHIPYLIKPAGDLSLSLVDFGKYIQWHLKGLQGEDNFISTQTYEYLHFGHSGFSIGTGNGKMLGHSFSGMDGSAGTFYCRAILLPDADFAFTILMNAGSGSARMQVVEWLTMKIVKQYFGWWWRFWM
jgi:CubicO group peptidase (beta-lactamase class C family)